MTRVLALVFVAGCIVVPKPVTTERLLRAYETPPVVALHGVTIDSATVSYATLHIEATQARVCSHQVRAVMEKRTGTSLGLAVSNLDGMPNVVLLLVGAFEVVALPATLLISGIVVVASHDHVETYDKSVRTVVSLCPVPAASVLVDISLPSGTSVQLATDAAGALAYRIPAGEPAAGVIIVRAGTSEARVAYP